MRFHETEPKSQLPLPDDYPLYDKDDPEQERLRVARGLSSRFEKPAHLSDKEWEAIRISPSEIRVETPWDGVCRNDCCAPLGGTA